MKGNVSRFARILRAQPRGVVVLAALLIVALIAGAVPSARAAAQHLVTGRDISDGSITVVDLADGAVNSQKILDGHVFPRDLSRGLRTEIARHAADGKNGKNGKDGKDGKDGAPGPAGPAGAPGPAGRDGESVTTAVIDPGDARCANGGVALTVGSQTVPVCNGTSGYAGAETTVQLTDVGTNWASHASATRDAGGWVHLTGYLTCLGNCADRVFTLPPGFVADPAKAVFPMLVEDATFPGSSSYYETDALVLQGDALSVGGGDTSPFNTLNIWVSGITFRAA